MKLNKFNIIIIIIIIIILLIFYYIPYFIIAEIGNISHKYLLSILTVKYPQIPLQKSFSTNFKNLQTAYPYTAGVAIDINNSGHEEIFIGGGEDQDDVLLSYQNGKLINIIDKTNLSSKSATYGGVSIDLDNDGYSDLIVARQNGVTLYKNNKNGTFSAKKIVNEQKDRSPIALSIVDYDKDGNADIYVSNFIRSKDLKSYQFNNPEHSKENILLKGDGKLNFYDVTLGSNIAGKHNTFTSIFTDLNNDNNPDLVVANDAGEIEIYENKNGKFIKHKMNTGFGFWMGVAPGDIDNDGDMDLFFANISGYTPEDSGFTFGTAKTGIKKDQKLNHEHIILRNDGNFKFTDVSDQYLKRKFGFGWGGVFSDLNLDGKLDLLFSSNYKVHPIHQYITHVQPVLLNKNKQFVQTYKYADFNYGQTPLVVDINKDNIKDVVWINMSGPIRVYANQNYDKNNYINIKLPSNIKFTNAKITLYLPNGQKYIRENIQGGIGFASDQSEMHSFGLNKNKKIDRIEVDTIYGDKYIYKNPKINSNLIVYDTNRFKKI